MKKPLKALSTLPTLPALECLVLESNEFFDTASYGVQKIMVFGLAFDFELGGKRFYKVQ